MKERVNVSIRRWGLGPTVLVMLVAGVGACGSGGDDESDGSEPETTTEEPAESTPSSLPAAADGTDLAACSDGGCEVEVAVDALPLDIPLDGSLGVDTLTVNAITDSIDVDSVGWGAQQHAEVPVGNAAQLNNVVVTLVAVEGNAALVRLAPADPPVTLPSVNVPPPPDFP